MPRADALETYRQKRRFDATPEPEGARRRPREGHRYAIQKHAARRLHYDLRLELDGVLLSWAVTKGPSLDPADKRLAVRTEDHPVEYIDFEGRIPEGNYGAGTVLLWDRGEWEPVGDPHEGLKRGKLAFEIRGERLRGRWALVRMRPRGRETRENWLLIKEKDDAVDRELEITEAATASVASGREMPQIAAAPEAVWRGAAEAGRPRARAPLPGLVAPQLATLVDDVPAGDGWLFEMKFDGYRAIAAASGDRVRIYTRNGLDWTERYGPIAPALAALDLDGVLLDGEIVVVDEQGRSDFGRLQNALDDGGAPLSYFVFDLLAEGGRSLRARPLRERKARLRDLLGDAGRRGPVFYTDHVEGGGGGRAMLDQLCAAGFEGVIAKKAAAPYQSARTRTWLKVKCDRTQEFVIIGWTPSEKDRPFASIILGQHAGSALVYAGRVGTGFSQDDLHALARRFAKLARRTPPVDNAPRDIARKARWIEPELVAQVRFAEVTADGAVRHGRFLGLREDKPAAEVAREEPVPAKGDGTAVVAGVRLTNPDRVMYPQQGLTKRDLAAYLAAAADRMLPHVADRLVSFVRCPEGQAKQCFFQRHATAGMPEAVHELKVPRKSGGEEPYLYLSDAAGLVAAAQMGVLELHIWGSRIDDVDRPDRMVFDLDPDPALGFAAVREAAVLLRDALDALGLRSFALLTGGKGAHVVVPLLRRHDWAEVKAFSGALAGRVAAEDPARYVATMTKAKRQGRVFIDYFRNDRSATAIAPYSPRAREGAPVAWPVTWPELEKAQAANAVSLDEARSRLGKADPWAGYAETRQAIKSSARKALGLA